MPRRFSTIRGRGRSSFRLILVAAIAAFLVWVGDNTIENLRRANFASGFGFLDDRAGFEISQTLIPYTIESTYARAFLVGLLNTLLVAVIGIVLATVIGFVVGIARLSSNWLIARLATVYVETLRNIPLLLLLLFWYRAVLSVLPGPRQGYELPFGGNLSNRGLILPRPIAGPWFWLTVAALVVAIVVVVILAAGPAVSARKPAISFRSCGPASPSSSACRSSCSSSRACRSTSSCRS